MVLEVDFIGPDGTVLSTVRGEGGVNWGLAGGSANSGIDEAVEKIAEYAEVQFN